MNKIKLILTVTLAFIVLFAQAGNAAAAPLAQDATPITGIIQSIVPETDATNVTTVVVTFVDDQNVTQTVRLDVDTAVTLGLVTLDPTTGELVVDETQIGEPVSIDPTTVIPDTTTEEESVNPISALLAGFFDVEASVVDGYHDDGFGFGVIAQALWMSRNLTGTEDQAGDASLAGDILEAKQDKDFEAFFESHPEYLTDGETIPTNWGQFRKAVLDKKNNLGVVVSGQAENSDSPSQQEHGNSNGNGQGNGNGNGNGNNNSNNGNNGNGHGNGNGNKP